MHTSRLDSYQVCREEVDSYVENVMARTQGATPMDIDSLYHKGKGKAKDKGKFKGAGKGKGFDKGKGKDK